jgi:hypothetical protein
MTPLRRTAGFSSLSLLVAITVLFVPTHADAQPEILLTQGAAQTDAHRFLDRQNMALTGAVIGAALADAITTQKNQQRYPELFREMNPLARPLVEKGWPGMSALLAMDIAAELGVRYLFHRKKHHRLERWTPIVPIALHVVGAIYNTRELRRAERSMLGR